MWKYRHHVCSDRTTGTRGAWRELLGLCGVLSLGLAWSVCARAAEKEAAPSMETLLSQLESNRFSERTAAQRALLQRAADHPEELSKVYFSAGMEERARLRQILEGIFLACADERGDRAERILMELEDAGSPSAQAILMGNSRLRESRAYQAIERLGASLTYIFPASDVPRLPPSPLAPGVGIGFGELAQLKAILIPESWTGTADDLWQFERLAHHQNLALYSIRGNRLTLDDLLPLTTKLIGTQITVRGACLGIVAIAGSPTADVGYVVEKSAAAAAGLLPHDRIEQLNQTPVRNFSHLVELLTEFHPGDQIVLQIRRNEERREISVTLASWKTVLHQELRPVPAPAPFPGPLGFGTPPPPEPPLPESETREYITPENN